MGIAAEGLNGADIGVDGSAAVPRTGLRPILLLDAAAPFAPVASATIVVGAP